MNIVLIVPTYNAGNSWSKWLDSVSSQNLLLSSVYIIDSSSSDDTVKLAKECGFTCDVISKEDFGHGKTRQFALQKYLNSDVVIFLTQDAFLASNDALNKLVNVFDDPLVGISYGRQLPRIGARQIEAHARIFNYPDKSHIRSIKDKEALGLKVAFTSNSFCAYRTEALIDVGGFPLDTIVSEDMYVAAKMLKKGWKIAYCSKAAVYHSHNYGYMDEFRRYFDIGVFNSREQWILHEFGNAESKGLEFIRSEVSFLMHKNIILIIESFFRTIIKFVGYRLGMIEKSIPVAMKRVMSAQSSYWN